MSSPTPETLLGHISDPIGAHQASAIQMADGTTVQEAIDSGGGGGTGSSGVLDAMNSTQQVVSTTTETTVATLAVPAGAVDIADTLLTVTAVGAHLQNPSTGSHIYRLKIDGTTVMTMTKSFAASGNLFPWTQQWTIACPTNATQRIGYQAIFGANLTAGSSGVAAAGATGNMASGFATTTVDMSGAHNITLTVEEPTSSASVYDNVYSVTLEKSAPL